MPKRRAVLLLKGVLACAGYLASFFFTIFTLRWVGWSGVTMGFIAENEWPRSPFFRQIATETRATYIVVGLAVILIFAFARRADVAPILWTTLATLAGGLVLGTILSSYILGSVYGYDHWAGCESMLCEVIGTVFGAIGGALIRVLYVQFHKPPGDRPVAGPTLN